ncbi:hypothetical protein [Stappia sp.]|uniref:hypothetical protein n=1 Tax=Stappia sp. TaxID=1870903 RepID=UPI003C7D59A0
MAGTAMIWVFEAFVIAHIVTGATGLVAFWVPVAGRKGGDTHRRFGRIFTFSMLATGAAAVGISIATLIAPLETHPHLPDAAFVRGIFGWMMLYLAVLTVNLAWYGWLCITLKRDRAAMRTPVNLALQGLLAVLAINCVAQGILIGEALMIGISGIGFATVATNLFYLYRARPHPLGWLKEHVKALVGAGISVYTAFFAFGAVRLMPEIALNPVLWSIPLIVGLSIIIYQWRAIARKGGGRDRKRPLTV